MEIDTESAFQLPPEGILPINIQRWLLCQSSEAGKLVKNPSQKANILDKLKLHEHHETGQYSKINKHSYSKKKHFKPKLILNQMLQKARNFLK